MNKRHLSEKDHGTSLRLFLYIWIMYAVVYMTKNCFSGAMATIVKEGIMTKSQTGLITALFYAVYAPFQIVGGKMADKYRPDILLLIGLLGAGLSNLIIYLNQNYIVMLITWTFNGIIQFGIWPAIFKIVSSELAHDHRIKGVYYITFASTFGLCFAFISGAIMTDWKNNFLLSAILMFISAVGLMLIYPKAAKKMIDDDGTPARAIHHDMEIPENLDTSSKTMFKKCGLYILLPALISRSVVELGVKNFAPTMFMESYPYLSDTISNYLNIPIILSSLIGMFIAKRLYPNRISDIMRGIRMFLTILIPLLGVMIFVGKINVVLILITLIFAMASSAAAGLFTQYYSMKFAKYGKNGEVAGIINAGASLGVVVQSFGLTLVADHFGWQAVMCVLVGLISAAVLLISIVIPKWKKFTREYHM
ncbi:MAG: MFS transporter [Oscillospiraceae bacterium]|nr:MFS transporter [Oscillospiraceae bacterium]